MRTILANQTPSFQGYIYSENGSVGSTRRSALLSQSALQHSPTPMDCLTRATPLSGLAGISPYFICSSAFRRLRLSASRRAAMFVIMFEPEACGEGPLTPLLPSLPLPSTCPSSGILQPLSLLSSVCTRAVQPSCPASRIHIYSFYTPHRLPYTAEFSPPGSFFFLKSVPPPGGKPRDPGGFFVYHLPRGENPVRMLSGQKSCCGGGHILNFIFISLLLLIRCLFNFIFL